MKTPTAPPSQPQIDDDSEILAFIVGGIAALAIAGICCFVVEAVDLIHPMLNPSPWNAP